MMQALSSEYRRRFLSRQLLFEKQYREVFENIADQFAELSQNPNAKFSRSFKFPEVINKRIEGIMTGFHEDLTRLTENEITQAWTIANEKNDKIVIQYLKTIHDIKASQKAAYFSPNISALSAFLSQKTGTESLSSMIWRVTNQARQEMEVHLGIGIANGDSASVISRRIRQYLNNPDALFRRVRDEKGKLIPSKRMSEYHPGQGVYKSSYKNAMRIARTETNMAYHASDNERWAQIDFVTGIKISLSAAHPVYNFPEICEVCAGVYPKEFIWIGWHPHCLCHATPVLMNKDDFREYLKTGIMKITQVTDYPDEFKYFVLDNYERFSNYSSVPYWFRDNLSTIDNIIKQMR